MGRPGRTPGLARPAPATARFQLKAATDDLHRELDDRLSRLDLANEADYRRFLMIQARTVPAIEAALLAGGFGQLVEGWSANRRTPLLERDLGDLGEVMPPPATLPAPDGTAQLLGTAYVLEGSRLGGTVLKRRVAPGLPLNFLGKARSRRPWANLIAVLDERLYSNRQIDEAKAAARRCFVLYLKIAQEAGIS